MQGWDLITTFGLLYTIVITPFEVGFLRSCGVNALFVCNQIMNGIFTVDLVVAFFTPIRNVKAPEASGEQQPHWIKSQ